MRRKYIIQNCFSKTVKIFIILTFLFPTVSHTKIVFSSKRSDGKTRHLYVMEDNGTNVQKITNSKFYDRSPRWFPDGKQILFERDLTFGNGGKFDAQIFKIDVDGRNEQLILADHPTDSEPSVSPDGKHIAFISKRTGEWDIFVLNLENQQLAQLTDNLGEGWSNRTDWSPDGKNIAYEHEGEDGETIHIMNSDGTGKKRLSPRRPAPFFLGAPRWSPSGKYIMYPEMERTWDLKNIVKMDLIILNVLTKRLDVHEFPNKALLASTSWMGDEETVLLSLKDDWTDPKSNYEIYQYDLNSKKLTNLTNEPSGDYTPSWFSGPLTVSALDKLTVRWAQLKAIYK